MFIHTVISSPTVFILTILRYLIVTKLVFQFSLNQCDFFLKIMFHFNILHQADQSYHVNKLPNCSLSNVFQSVIGQLKPFEAV